MLIFKAKMLLCVFQVLLDVTAVEFVTFMRLLTSLPSMNTLVGRQQLVDIVAEQADLNSAFNVRVLAALDFAMLVMMMLKCYQRSIKKTLLNLPVQGLISKHAD